MAAQSDAATGGILTLPTITRIFGWCILAALFIFVFNSLTSGGEGLASAFFAYNWSDFGSDMSSSIRVLLYPLGFFLAVFYVLRTQDKPLRQDSAAIESVNTFFIRAAFWAVLIIGIADLIISALRVEGLLEAVVGNDLAGDLGRSQFRGMYVHMPLLGLSIVLAALTRTIGFHWLALLIVMAELLIVFMRFVFGYEQAYMADLVRFWYGALFLFASGYTLLDEGHVRVDVFYAGFASKTKGAVNAIATILMGITLCWTILIVGMGQRSSIINSPLFTFEVTQAGFGLYVKYMMAGFLGVFAISMMIVFVAYLFASVADYRGDPGARVIENPGGH